MTARSMPYRIAYLPGDGVGPEVLGEARKAVDASGVPIRWTDLDWGSDYYAATGRMMPVDALEVVRAHDAVLMGAVGSPSVDDPVALWGMILLLRQELDLWVNIRPVRLLAGLDTPLAGRSSEIDMLFLRENTEGEYAGVGGRAHGSLAEAVAIEVSVFTRSAIERLARYSFEAARARRGKLTSATKSNASRYGYVLWDEVFAAVSREYSDVVYERMLVDALAARMIRDPGSLDVVVASNLFGDILTDVGAAIQGGMGTAASANVAPGSSVPGVFEPVHGSAPDIAGRGVANPAGAIWSAALMLEHLGEMHASTRILAALEDVCQTGPRTQDVGGRATTVEVGDAVQARLQAGNDTGSV